MGFRDSW